jgi:hypothetical protein
MALPVPPSPRSRLASLLPVLCLIHCIGTALFAAAMPAAALWMRNEWLEGGLTLLSAVLIGAQVLRRNPDSDPAGASLAIYLSAVVMSALGWLYGQEWPRHIGLLLLVAAQLFWLRSRRTRPSCDCVDHGHGVALASD